MTQEREGDRVRREFMPRMMPKNPAKNRRRRIFIADLMMDLVDNILV
jgi:hypothetical protein